MRDVLRGWGPGCYAHPHYEPGSGRDVRRLHDAGLAVAVVSKGGLCTPVREIALFATREEALRQYPRAAIMRRT